MTSLENKKVLVVGMARSGQAAARFLATLGARVTGTDIKRQSELDLDPGGMGPCFELVAGGYPELRRGKYDLLVVSPGVPLTIAPLAEAAQLGIPVWSELELASRFIREPIIAITGTNGKTTTTALAGYIFEKAGRRVVVAGNIGIPLIGEVERTLRERSGVDYWIVEVSSFQLERSHNFRPHIAVLLNLTPDHLDRHRTLEEYGRVKARLFQNQDSGDHAVLNLEDPWVNSRVEKLRAQKCWFSTKRVPATGIGIEEGTIAYAADGLREDLCQARSILIPGPHNLANALAASATALLAGIGRETIAAALSTFPGVPHRLEPAGMVGGVRYVNDSKGTNPDSVLKALDSFSEPIILIAGGKAKGSDFSALAERIKAGKGAGPAWPGRSPDRRGGQGGRL